MFEDLFNKEEGLTIEVIKRLKSAACQENWHEFDNILGVIPWNSGGGCMIWTVQLNIHTYMHVSPEVVQILYSCHADKDGISLASYCDETQDEVQIIAQIQLFD